MIRYNSVKELSVFWMLASSYSSEAIKGLKLVNHDTI
jgi:hypothetical protein